MSGFVSHLFERVTHGALVISLQQIQHGFCVCSFFLMCSFFLKFTILYLEVGLLIKMLGVLDITGLDTAIGPGQVRY